MLGKNLTIVKAENGNVLIYNDTPDLLVSIPTGTPIELNNTLLQFRLGLTAGGGVISFGANQVSQTQMEGSAAVPFTGTIQDLFAIMEEFVASPAGGGGGDASGAKQDEQTQELRDINANLVDVLVNQVSGAQVSKSYSEAVGAGLIDGASYVQKSAYNASIGVISEPNIQVIGAGGGIYTGFVATDNNVQVLSSSNSDTGTLQVTFLRNSTSTEYETLTIPVTGTTPSNSAFKAYRIHTANFIPSNPAVTPYNLGTITIRQVGNPGNVFGLMLPYRNQTNTGVYTVPKGKIAVIEEIRYTTGNSGGGSTSAFVHTAIQVKATSEVFYRTRRPNIVAYGVQVTDKIEGGLWFGESTDIALVVTEANTANTKISASFSIIVKPA